MSDKKFASQADLVEKKVSFDKLSDHAYAYTAEGDPNSGIIVGDEAVMARGAGLMLMVCCTWGAAV